MTSCVQHPDKSTIKPSDSAGCVILAAGSSSRMGQNKLLLKWGNTSVIGHLIKTWNELGAGQVVVVIRKDDNSLIEELKRSGVDLSNTIVNPAPQKGMFSSIKCAAQWLGWKKHFHRFAIVLGDQPQIKFETLMRLLKFSSNNPDLICQPVYKGKKGHPIVLPEHVFKGLSNSNAVTLRDAIRDCGVRTIHCEVDDPGLLLDIDTFEEYNRIYKMYFDDF